MEASRDTADVPLGDTEWTLVADESVPSFVLDLEESHVAGTGGVNRLMGTFALSESELRFGPLATTLMAGAERAMQPSGSSSRRASESRLTRSRDQTLTLLADDVAVAQPTC